MRILLFSGSFHSKSKSLIIANFVKNYLSGHHCEIPRLDMLPLYSEDLNQDKPVHVSSFLESVNHGHGIICVTPEHNHSVPAVLKNAIDWASRPAFQSPLKGKAVTIIAQAEGHVGGARVQAHLKLILDSTLSLILPSHEMMISNAGRAMNSDGEISDVDTKRRIIRHIDEFLAFARRVDSSSID